MKKLFIVSSLILSTKLWADISVPPRVSNDIWHSIDLISKFEDLPIIKSDTEKQFFEIDKIECVFESYDACSFFSDINGERKLIVSIDGSSKLISGLEQAGVGLDAESDRLEAQKLSCSKTGVDASCTIVEYDKN